MYFLSDSHKIQLFKSVVPLPSTRLTEKDHWRELRWKTAVRLRENADAEKSHSSSQIRPRAWTRPSKGREEERKRESERKERAKMGTDRLLRSVPDFRSSASRDLALTNDFRTVCSLPLTTHHSQPLLSSHIGSRSTHQQGGQAPGPRYVSIPHWFSLNLNTWRTALAITVCFHPTLVLAQQEIKKAIDFLASVSIPHWFSLNRSFQTKLTTPRKFPSHIGSRSTLLGLASHNGLSHVSIPHWFSLNFEV